MASRPLCIRPLVSRLVPSLIQTREILVDLPFSFADLNEKSASLKLQLVAFLYRSSFQPVCITDQVRMEVIDHGTFVESMES